ncbi:MAG: peptidylprolyl isomerase [Nannocystaceae bacterium]|nr:peptidylprolyl isomerase [Nannocystaceae bacterium]
MKVQAGHVATLTYDITNDQGEIIESSDLSGPVSFLVGKGAIIKGLDSRIVGMDEGEEAQLTIPPEEAFGRPDEGPTRPIPRSEFPKEAKLDKGLRFEAGMAASADQTIMLEVVSSDDEIVTVRMIHPLAGQTIGMAIKVLSVREATSAETQAGRAVSKPPPPPPPKS